MEAVVDLKKRMRNVIIASWLIALSFVMIILFWYNEYQYSLPTPIPANYENVNIGSKVNLGHKVSFSSEKPVLLHFFNPDCPCSKFNIRHFKFLVSKYHTQMNFAIVLMTDKDYTPAQIQGKFGLNIPVLKDKSIATQCGVYSTPQAAILDVDNRLYFRGNYNRSRYCDDTNTEYARIAAENLLQQKALQKLDRYAFQAYGCKLPYCKQY